MEELGVFVGVSQHNAINSGSPPCSDTHTAQGKTIRLESLSSM